MARKLFFKQGDIDAWDRHMTHATGGQTYAGDMLAGTFNGICTGFSQELLFPDAIIAGATTHSIAKFVAASAGGDLATPVAYWLKHSPFRLRIGSVTAAAIAASTTGIAEITTLDTAARGILRMQLADVVDAAQILLDQGNLAPISMSRSWKLCVHVSYARNASTLETIGSSEFGVIGGALGVDPTAVMNAAGVHFTIAESTIRSYSVSTTATLLATKILPTGDFVVTFEYDSTSRNMLLELDGRPFGSYVVPAAVTDMQIAGRVMHQAAYVVATHDPVGLAIDDIIWYSPNV